MIPYIQLTQSA